LSTHPNPTLTKLNLSTLGMTAAGIQSLATDVLPKCTGLTYLDLSGNKIELATQVSRYDIYFMRLLMYLFYSCLGKTPDLAPLLFSFVFRLKRFVRFVLNFFSSRFAIYSMNK
jgi:hypothetical protein